MFDNNSAVLKLSFGQERLRLEAWGKDSIRVRAGQGHIAEDLFGALIADRPTDSAGAGSDGQTLVNGKMTAQSLEGMVSFWRSEDGREPVFRESPLLVARTEVVRGTGQRVLPHGATL